MSNAGLREDFSALLRRSMFDLLQNLVRKSWVAILRRFSSCVALLFLVSSRFYQHEHVEDLGLGVPGLGLGAGRRQGHGPRAHPGTEGGGRRSWTGFDPGHPMWRRRRRRRRRKGSFRAKTHYGDEGRARYRCGW